VVIFDIDGTLVDSVDLIVASYQNAFRQVLGREGDETEIRTWIGQSLRDSLTRAFPGSPDQVAVATTAYLDWNEAHMPSCLKACAGMVELTADLAKAGIRLGAVTSKRAKNAAWSLELADLAETVPLLVTADETDRHKPDPAPLLLAAHKLDVSPQQCVYVGDAATDIEAAQRAGMGSVAVTWGAGTMADLVAAQPDALCASTAQLREALLGDKCGGWEVPRQPGP